MAASELISVIVPVYRVEDYLDRCIKSIVNQTYQNLEIILVDDGSPDQCPKICDMWSRKDSRIWVIHKENGGVSSARNAGLRIATGDWISFVDSDDWIHPQFFETLHLQATKRPSANIIAVNMDRVKEEKPYSAIKPEEIEFHSISVDSIFHNKTIRNYVWGRLYCRESIKGRVFDETLLFGEDSIFNAQLFADDAVTVLYSSERMYYYFQRDDSAVHQFSLPQLVLLFEKYLDLSLKESREYPKSYYTMEAMKRALSARYGLQFDSKHKEKKEELDLILKNSSKDLRSFSCVSFKNKLIFSAFSFSPQLYRLYRVINDPTLLKWEKEIRKQWR